MCMMVTYSGTSDKKISVMCEMARKSDKINDDAGKMVTFG